jgi:hypothetical protein
MDHRVRRIKHSRKLPVPLPWTGDVRSFINNFP